MSVFDKNLAALSDRYPDIVNKHYADGVCSKEDIKDNIVVNVEDVCGKTVFSVCHEDRIYQLDSLYDDSELLELWFKGLRNDWPLDAKLLMFGFGSGMYARYFLKAARNDVSIVIHEPSMEIFDKLIETVDISDLIMNPRVTIVFGCLVGNVKMRDYYAKHISYIEMKYLVSSVYLNYLNFYHDDAKEFFDGIDELFERYEASKGVFERFGGYFSKNALCNFKFLTDSLYYPALKNSIPSDVPAIIVAAGPSLDKNIEEIKRAEGKAFIIATITALKPLALKGITPDITVNADGKKDVRYMSEESSKQVPMICNPICGYDINEAHQGKKMFVDFCCNHILKFMEEHGLEFNQIDSGGSVAHSCYTIAKECGCKTIILVGQDLAYTDDKTHSTVTVRGAWNTKVEDFEHPIMAVDINGNPIRSSLEFEFYRKWYEEKINNDADLTVIDATEGGVKIEGTKTMTLRDAIDKYCVEDFNFAKILNKVPECFDEHQKEEYIQYIRRVPEQFNSLMRIVKETQADYLRMKRIVETDKYHSSEMKSLYSACKDNTRRVEENPIIEYVHNQLEDKSSELLTTVNNLEENEKTELLTVCEMGYKYLNDMEQAIEEIKPYIETVKKDFFGDSFSGR